MQRKVLAEKNLGRVGTTQARNWHLYRTELLAGEVCYRGYGRGRRQRNPVTHVPVRGIRVRTRQPAISD